MRLKSGSPEHREMLKNIALSKGYGKWMIGKKHSTETRAKMSESRKGCLHPMYGKKHTEQARKKQSEARLGKEPWNKGMKGFLAGEKHWHWNPNRTQAIEKHRIRSTREWKEWRKFVFERDGYACQECSVRGVYLEPHHIIPIRSDWNKLFDTNNGITLCRPCHIKTMGREEQFADKYTAIVNKVLAYCVQ